MISSRAFLFGALLIASFSSYATSAVEISILSQNVWFILIASIPAADRIPDYIETFKNGTYDILCLQEVWSGTKTIYPDTLYEGLKEIYPYNVSTQPYPLDGLNLGLDSGLMILSKFPIDSWDFHRYTNCSFLDCAAGKGAMTARIKVPDENGDDVDVVVSNTHFNAGGPLDIRLGQAGEMRSAVDRFLEALKANNTNLNVEKIPVFGAGDFNTDEWNSDVTEVQDDYNQLLQALGSTTNDIFRTLYPRDVDVGLTTNSSRIDYVFGLSGEYETVSAGVDRFVETANPQFRLSDHLGAHITVKVEKTASTGGGEGSDSEGNSNSSASALGLLSSLSLALFFSSLLCCCNLSAFG